MKTTTDLKDEILNRIQDLDLFIRKIEDFATLNKINLSTEKTYLIAVAQRRELRSLIK